MSAMPLPDYLEQGSGDTAVFLLHGVGGGAGAWTRTLPVLAQAGYRAIAWDAPGYGRTASIQPFTTRALAESFLGLIAHIGASRNVVLGHSMGGMIAQEACALLPQAIQGLVLFATSPAFGKPGGDWQQQFLQSRFAPLDAGAGMAGLAPDLVRGMFAPGTHSAEVAGAMTEAVALMSAVPESTYRAALAAIVSFNRLENLPHIRVPTLCLACELDQNAAPAVMQKMASRIAGAHYECLTGAGHLGNMEAPGAFNAAILKYLRQYFPISSFQ